MPAVDYFGQNGLWCDRRAHREQAVEMSDKLPSWDDTRIKLSTLSDRVPPKVFASAACVIDRLADMNVPPPLDIGWNSRPAMALTWELFEEIKVQCWVEEDNIKWGCEWL